MLGAEPSQVIKEKRARGGGGSAFLPDPRAKDDSVEGQFARLSGMLAEEGDGKESLLKAMPIADEPKKGGFFACCGKCCSDEDEDY